MHASGSEYDRLPQRRLRAGGGEIAYVDAGEGPAVVLVHGSPVSSFAFRAQIAALAAAHRVIAPDLLGFGRSSAPEGGADFTLQSAAVRDLLDRLGLARFGLVVHDWGGAAALGAVAHRPEQLSGLVLLNTSFRPGFRPPFYWRPLVGPVLGELLLVRANAFGNGLPLLLRSARDREVWRRYREPLRRTASRRTILALERLRGYEAECGRIVAALPEIRCPKLLLWGTPDPYFRASERRRMRALLPDADLVLLEGAGHFSQEDAPERVSAELGRFFAAAA